MQIRFRLDLNSNRVRKNLLQGLDNWVQLGLLSDQQIKEISATLSDRLPNPQIAPTSEPAAQEIASCQRRAGFR